MIEQGACYQSGQPGRRSGIHYLSSTATPTSIHNAATACCGTTPFSGLPQQDRARVADQACPVARDLQGMAPRHMLHREERSSPGN
jgi:hypothetical protein